MASRTVTYGTGDVGEVLSYDTYELGGAARKWLLVVHGGGWFSGDKADAQIVSICTRANAEGWGAAAVNYPLASTVLSTRFNYRAPIQELRVADAFDHILAHLATYNFTGTGALLGVSSGGHIGALVSNRSTGTKPVAFVGMSGIYEPLLLLPPQQTVARNYCGAPVDRVPERWAASSPTHLVSALTPPSWLSNSVDEEDRVDNVGVLLSQMTGYSSALDSFGITHHACVVPGDGHGAGNLDVLVPDEGNVSVWTLIAAWLHDASRLG